MTTTFSKNKNTTQTVFNCCSQHFLTKIKINEKAKYSTLTPDQPPQRPLCCVKHKFCGYLLALLRQALNLLKLKSGRTIVHFQLRSHRRLNMYNNACLGVFVLAALISNGHAQLCPPRGQERAYALDVRKMYGELVKSGASRVAGGVASVACRASPLAL